LVQQLPLRALFLKHAGQQARSARIILLAGMIFALRIERRTRATRAATLSPSLIHNKTYTLP